MIEINDNEIRLSEAFLKYATSEEVLKLAEICENIRGRQAKGRGGVNE